MKTYQDPVLQDVTFAAAQTAAPTLAGSIDALLYWYRGLAGWARLDSASPPLVPLGTDFYLGVAWVNESGAPIRGHVDLTVTRPDGTAVALSAPEDQVADPGKGWIYSFGPLTLDQVGTYQGRAVLSGVGA